METSSDSKGLKKLWVRVKAHVRSGSTSSPSASPTTKPIIAPAPVAEPKKEETTPSPQILESQPTAPSGKDEAMRRFERAQAIFQKYDLELDPEDWNMPSKANVERVQKPVRMRIRWTCHECKTTFGHDKICNQCSHTRCKDCIRYPAKKPKSKNGVKDKLAPPATMPTKGPCHECRTEFDIGATECANCKHQICDKCLKETVVESPATAPPTATPVAVSAA